MKAQFSDSISDRQASLWHNDDNNSFYEGLIAQDFSRFAVTGGLDTCCDVELILPYLDPESAVLEIGAGYGRVLDYLLNKDFKNLFAIERAGRLCEFLKDKYARCERIKLFEGDLKKITDTELGNKFDSILLLWSFIAEFAKDEQPEIIKRVAKLLKPGGKMFVDAMPLFIKPLYTRYICKQTYMFRFKGMVLYAYCPTIKEIESYTVIAGIHSIRSLEYKTRINRGRIMNIISRPYFLL